jgi:vacuolar-type H+-ATPase subunit I/STV1
VVDLEGELISALEEIYRLGSKKKKKKKILVQFERDNKGPDEDFSLLKMEIEVANKIEDILKQQLSEKKARCEALEEEVVKTKKEMEKFKTLYLQNLPSIKAATKINDILSKQRSPLLNTSLGYVNG